MEGTEVLEKSLENGQENNQETTPAQEAVSESGEGITTVTQELPDSNTDSADILDNALDDAAVNETVDARVSEYVSEYIEEYTSDAASETKRIIAETAVENQRLDNLFKPNEEAPPPKKKKRRPYTIGILSAAASLIFIGAVLFTTLVSPVEAFKAIYFAPVILIFIGAEILFTLMRRKSFNQTLDIKSMLICLTLIIVTFALSAISKSVTPSDVQRSYAADRIKHIIARDISEVLTCERIRNVNAEVTLCADDPSIYDTPNDLIVGDTVNITVYFSDEQVPVREFAADCRQTLDELTELGYSFGTVTFINDDTVNRYTISLDWLYQQNYDEMSLVHQALYFGDNIPEADISDIEDTEENDPE